MTYRGVLPATGGGAVLFGVGAGIALGLQQWILAVVIGVLSLTLFGAYRLFKGQHGLRRHH